MLEPDLDRSIPTCIRIFDNLLKRNKILKFKFILETVKAQSHTNIKMSELAEFGGDGWIGRVGSEMVKYSYFVSLWSLEFMLFLFGSFSVHICRRINKVRSNQESRTFSFFYYAASKWSHKTLTQSILGGFQCFSVKLFMSLCSKKQTNWEPGKAKLQNYFVISCLS